MTKQFNQYINELQKKLWDKSNEGEISEDKIKMTIKMTAGSTVVDKYWEGLETLNIIEQVPDTDIYIVTKPEKKEIKPSNDTVVKNIRLPENVAEAGERYGISFTKVMTQAVIEEVSSLKDFVKNHLTGNLDEDEVEYIFELMKNSLHNKKGRDKVRAKRDRRRRKLYQDIFDKQVDADHIEKLRQKSFELNNTL